MVNESVGDIVYHFTNMYSLGKIMYNDSINFTKATSKLDKGLQKGKYDYFLSLTRQSSPGVGYAFSQNNKVNGKAILPEFDFSNINVVELETFDKKNKYTHIFGGPTGKKRYGIIDNNLNKNALLIKQHNQTEERILSNKENFKGVYDFITRIDIFTTEKNLKVRISFDGNKLSKQFDTTNVDYLYLDYLHGLEAEANKIILNKSGKNSVIKKSKTIKEAIGRKPKFDGLYKDEWSVLLNFCKSAKNKLKEENPELAQKLIRWSEKIFIHTKNRTKHLGVPMLNKFSNKFGIMKNNEWEKFAEKNAGGVTRYDFPTVKDSINAILSIIFLATPPSESIDTAIRTCYSYFDGFNVYYDNKLRKLSDVLIENIKPFFDKKQEKLNKCSLLKDPLDRKEKIYSFLVNLYRPLSDITLSKKIKNELGLDIFASLNQILPDFCGGKQATDYQVFIFHKYYVPYYNIILKRAQRTNDNTDKKMVKEMALRVLHELNNINK